MKAHMTVVRNTLTLALGLSLLAVAVTLADVVRKGSFQASSDGANVTLHWITEDESGVAQFEIERRTGPEGNFLSIATIAAKGSSLYEFVDYSAFRKLATIYQYRIKIVYVGGGPPAYVGPLTVSHTVSGVRRTWGSIKEMFR